MSPDEASIRDLVSKWQAATRSGDAATVLSLMTDDVVFENTGDQRLEGQAAVCGFFRRFFETTPMAWFDTEDMFAVGDRCVVRWILTFNKEEPERGRVRGVDVFRVGDGRVAEKFSYVKSAEVVRKLGLQPGGSKVSVALLPAEDGRRRRPPAGPALRM